MTSPSRPSRPAPPAALYVVATPIGNLDDITLRAVAVLEACSTVAAEDTRRTRALLSHLGITGKTLMSLDAHASQGAVDAFVARAQSEVVCLVTDAGMPTISDPGVLAVRRAADIGVGVVVVPGPSAVTTAVAASGLVDQEFSFLGFLPRKGDKRRQAVARMVLGVTPTVFFEAPSRMAGTLAELAEQMPERRACVARELTKLHEEVLRMSLGELASLSAAWRGELTVVVAADAEIEPGADDAPDWEEIDRRIVAALSAGAAAKTVARDLAAALGLPRKQLYSRVLDVRLSEPDDR